MFAKPREQKSETGITTVIGDDARFEGNLQVQGSLRIEGSFKGEIEAGGTVILGEMGRITGKVKASHFKIAGKFDGDVELSGKLEVAPKGELQGNAKMELLVVEEGGIFQGTCEMLTQSPISPGNKTKLPAEKPTETPKANEKKE